MGKNTNTFGPPRPQQHESGDFGERFVAYVLPEAWIVHSYKGTEDYGIDFHVEVFSSGKPTGWEFGIQVKTYEKLSARPRISITRNNLLYMLAKPYPCMISVVSCSERRARFAWVREIFSQYELIKYLSTTPGKPEIRAVLHPSNDLENASTQIASYLQKQKETKTSWYLEEAHRQTITELYFDLHASLDALIECIAIIDTQNHNEDEVSHKGTFTIVLTLTSYGLLYHMTRSNKIESLGPEAATIVAIRQQFRQIIAEFILEESIKDQVEEPRDHSQIGIVPGSMTKFWPAVPRLTRLLRDALRILSVLIAPWRNFDLEMSGLASSVIEYPHRTAPLRKK